MSDPLPMAVAALRHHDCLWEFVTRYAVKMVDASRDTRLIRLLEWALERHVETVCTCNFEPLETWTGMAAHRHTRTRWADLTAEQLAVGERHHRDHQDSTLYKRIQLEKAVREYLART